MVSKLYLCPHMVEGMEVGYLDAFKKKNITWIITPKYQSHQVMASSVYLGSTIFRTFLSSKIVFEWQNEGIQNFVPAVAPSLKSFADNIGDLHESMRRKTLKANLHIRYLSHRCEKKNTRRREFRQEVWFILSFSLRPHHGENVTAIGV